MKLIGRLLSFWLRNSRWSLSLALVFALVVAGLPASGFEYGEVATGTSSKSVDNYRFAREPVYTDNGVPDGELVGRDYFPLYGSREERIFKPWLRVFSTRRKVRFSLEPGLRGNRRVSR
ncbi:MAG: hypothetical protein GTN70_11440 [Deltaproteobacteria bacterium]|nr:hypothetical protein [Deltaproteobacteria bacterium]NIS78386.1 hypothetical protein [Deltaproteobacteria bacterium]